MRNVYQLYTEGKMETAVGERVHATDNMSRESMEKVSRCIARAIQWHCLEHCTRVVKPTNPDAGMFPLEQWLHPVAQRPQVHVIHTYKIHSVELL